MQPEQCRDEVPCAIGAVSVRAVLSTLCHHRVVSWCNVRCVRVLAMGLVLEVYIRAGDQASVGERVHRCWRESSGMHSGRRSHFGVEVFMQAARRKRAGQQNFR